MIGLHVMGRWNYIPVEGVDVMVGPNPHCCILGISMGSGQEKKKKLQRQLKHWLHNVKTEHKMLFVILSNFSSISLSVPPKADDSLACIVILLWEQFGMGKTGLMKVGIVEKENMFFGYILFLEAHQRAFFFFWSFCWFQSNHHCPFYLKGIQFLCGPLFS